MKFNANNQNRSDYCFNQNENFNKPRKGMTVCKTCGTQIAKNAKACPNCGAHRSSIRPAYKVMLFIVIFFIVAGVISTRKDSPKKVGTNTGADSSPAPVSQQVYTVGDTLEMQNVQVTLKDVRVSDGKDFNTPSNGNVFLVFEFDIANNSFESIAVSSMLSFDAYADDYALNYSLSAIFADDGKQLDGTIASGKKMNGIVGFEATKDWKKAEVRFKPNVWVDKEFVFTIDRSQAK